LSIKNLYAIVATLAVLGGYPGPSRMPPAFASIDVPADPVDVPDALRAASGDAPASLTSIVWIDIDSDGDLDVAATNASLDLLVWVNDGSGHLTRKPPAPGSTSWADSDAPIVDGHGARPRIGVRSQPPQPSGIIAIHRDAQRVRHLPSFDACVKSFATSGTLRGPPFPRITA
jgi:hypothetical protein